MVNLIPNKTSGIAAPGQKYGHLSEVDPEFAPLREACDEQFKALWALPLEQFRTEWKNAPVVLPEDAPTDLSITRQMVPVRDGTNVEIKIYKAKDVPENALLYFVAHGGGKTIQYSNVWIEIKNG